MTTGPIRNVQSSAKNDTIRSTSRLLKASLICFMSGKAAVRKVLGDRFRVITDMRWDHVDSFITGNRAVTVWMVTGTGVDSEKLNYRGCDLYEFRGDKVLSKDTYWKLVEHRDRL